MFYTPSIILGMNHKYEDKLLADWEGVFRQGLLTFWVFVALTDGPQSTTEIKERVEKLTNHTYSAAEQTLYRLLRKHYDLELVDFKEVPGSGGPNKKLYSLSPLGQKLLQDFAARNISLFYRPTIRSLTKEKKENETN